MPGSVCVSRELYYAHFVVVTDTHRAVVRSKLFVKSSLNETATADQLIVLNCLLKPVEPHSYTLIDDRLVRLNLFPQTRRLEQSQPSD